MDTSRTIQTISAGKLHCEDVQLVERKFGGFAVQHWSGGDDVIAERIESGEQTYWTIIQRNYATACHGKRWLTREGAESWLTEARKGLDCPLCGEEQS